MEKLLKHGWPGNIRELENAIEHACVTTRGTAILPEDLSGGGSGARGGQSPVPIDLSRPLPDLLRDLTATVERQYLMRALKKSRGNVGRCARICGMSRRSVSAKLAEYNIKKEPFKEE